jgi:hypothetical protein
LVTRLQPYGLTKGEVLTIINLGVGLDRAGLVPTTNSSNNIHENQDVVMENGGAITETIESGEGVAQNEEEAEDQEAAAAAAVGGGEGEGEDDYGALALFDSVVEEREERLSDEDVTAILAIVRETLGKRNG